jgi:broad specificity phosphatase PhoE
LSSIVLIRHGPVAVKASGLLSFQAFAAFISAYEEAGIEACARPPAQLIPILRRVSRIYASDAPRVTETLSRLGVTADVVDASYREAPPRAPRLPGQWPEIVWLALARARGAFDPALAPARADLRRRVRICCDELREAALQGDVALIGHGWFNRAVAKDLAAEGWRQTGPGFRRPWGHLALSPPPAKPDARPWSAPVHRRAAP